jgi:putative ATP-binding cassette transporter
MRVVHVFRGISLWPLLLAVGAGIVSGIVTTGLLAFVNQAIRTGRFGEPAVLAGFAGLCLLRLVAGIGAHWLLIHLSQSTLSRMRVELCTQIAHTRLATLESLGSHRLLSALIDDLGQVATTIINLPYLLVNLVIVAGCLIYLGYLSWGVLLGIGSCMAVGALSYWFAVRRANNLLRRSREHQDHLYKFFRQLLDGIKELSLDKKKREAFLKECVRPAAEDVRQNQTRGISLYAAAANWNRLLFFVYIGVLLWFWTSGGSQPVATMASYVLVILYLMAPIEAILNTLPHMAQAEVALRQIDQLGLALAPAALPANVVEDRRSMWQRIEFSAITYQYPKSDAGGGFVLGPIDLAIVPGRILFITGGNGSGKTTMAKLLTGLYSPTGGRILLDGKEISAASDEDYRHHFATVFSDYGLFDRLLGMDAKSCESAAQQYLRDLQLEHKVEIINGRFSTTALSQGQRKRLALLVALLEDRSVYVFDEWAADQDPQFRALFYHSLLPDLARRGKAVVVITHDDRYFHLADDLFKLDEGRFIPAPSQIVESENTKHSGRACA